MKIDTDSHGVEMDENGTALLKVKEEVMAVEGLDLSRLEVMVEGFGSGAKKR